MLASKDLYTFEPYYFLEISTQVKKTLNEYF